MIFLEKEEYGFRKWELQINQRIPCTDEEKKIYGVESKIDINVQAPYVVEMNFSDGGKFYEIGVRTHNYSNLSGSYFKDLEKAQEFLVERFKDK